MRKPLLLSISDDDLCAECKRCEYRPGDMSGCKLGWPGTFDADGYCNDCTEFRPVKTESTYAAG